MYRLFKELEISLSQEQQEQFECFTRLLLEWNQKMNLTAITEPDEIVLKHYLDSAMLIQTNVIRQGMKTIDVGCGAGFPSVPAKIIRPDLKFTLLDSLNKRLHFLDCVIERLGLEGIETLHMRAEDAGQDKRYRQQYELCVARAVAPLNVLMEYCTPFLERGGYFVALKGPDGIRELEEAGNALQTLCMKVHETIELQLPSTNQKRMLLVFQKVGDTPSAYPRKAGKPSKKPL